MQNSPKFVRAVKKRKRNVFYIIQQTSKQFTTNNYITAELCKLKQFKRLSTNFKAFWKNFGQIKILPTSLQIFKVAIVWICRNFWEYFARTSMNPEILRESWKKFERKFNPLKNLRGTFQRKFPHNSCKCWIYKGKLLHNET